ncbi:hypothetical protein [uncultured Microbacterium sp.]|uniref:hypothetical protein n=1 Tax=uncultured Microbacterium sp. TaxID=191216 RepID=UPI0028D40497|nr:hypothetical protein [uncultured Microbacterium sp.]
MTPPSLAGDSDRTIVRGDGYMLAWRTGPAGLVKSPYFELSDAEGSRWMRLSALSSAHTREGRDETTAVREPTVAVDDDAIVIVVSTESPAWSARALVVRCTGEAIELTLEAEGDGALEDVTLLGGDGVLPSGASGTFRSGLDAKSIYVPSPTEPVAFVRPVWSAASLGVVGDADPGRLNGVFSPPPFALAFGRDPAVDAFAPGPGAWLGLWLRGAVEELGFTTLRYEPVDDGALLRLNYEGHTRVDGRWRSPTIVIRPVDSPKHALEAHRSDLVAHGHAPAGRYPPASWWLQPIFCGWGGQVARGGTADAPAFCRQEVYDDFLAALSQASLEPGTIVVDDRWQAQYATAEPDAEAWPDLRGWIARRHAEGRRVLLWWKAWDPTGLPVDECITDAAGRAVAADPGSPAYLSRLDGIIDRLLGRGGLDADGFKVDFTQRTPSGATMRSAADSDGVWGVAALHRLVGRIHRTAKAVKPDALIITHTVHPSFGDICDMVRTNDVLEHDVTGAPVSVAAQLRARFEIVAATMPDHPVDTDQWPMPSRDEWLDYARTQGGLGVPALYYIERVADDIDRLDPAEVILPEHLAVIQGTWADYRSALE